MMKRARKLAALLLALVMALTLAACGGKGGSKTNPAVGKYMGEAVLSFDEWIPMDDVYDLGDNYIELREDGTGCFMLDGDPTEIEWKLGKDGALTLDRDGETCNCTLKDGLIMVNDYFGFDLKLTFRKSEGSSTGGTNAGNTDSTGYEFPPVSLLRPLTTLPRCTAVTGMVWRVLRTPPATLRN